MAGFTIEKRKLSSGEQRYKCVVREKSKGEIIHNESRTFSTKTLADAWGKKQVQKLESEKVSDRKETVTLGTLLNMYFELPQGYPVFLMREFVEGGAKELPDPFGQDLEVYRECREHMVEAIPSLVDWVEKNL